MSIPHEIIEIEEHASVLGAFKPLNKYNKSQSGDSLFVTGPLKTEKKILFERHDTMVFSPSKEHVAVWSQINHTVEIWFLENIEQPWTNIAIVEVGEVSDTVPLRLCVSDDGYFLFQGEMFPYDEKKGPVKLVPSILEIIDTKDFGNQYKTDKSDLVNSDSKDSNLSTVTAEFLPHEGLVVATRFGIYCYRPGKNPQVWDGSPYYLTEPPSDEFASSDSAYLLASNRIICCSEYNVRQYNASTHDFELQYWLCDERVSSLKHFLVSPSEKLVALTQSFADKTISLSIYLMSSGLPIQTMYINHADESYFEYLEFVEVEDSTFLMTLGRNGIVAFWDPYSLTKNEQLNEPSLLGMTNLSEQIKLHNWLPQNGFLVNNGFIVGYGRLGLETHTILRDYIIRNLPRTVHLNDMEESIRKFVSNANSTDILDKHEFHGRSVTWKFKDSNHLIATNVNGEKTEINTKYYGKVVSATLIGDDLGILFNDYKYMKIVVLHKNYDEIELAYYCSIAKYEILPRAEIASRGILDMYTDIHSRSISKRRNDSKENECLSRLQEMIKNGYKLKMNIKHLLRHKQPTPDDVDKMHEKNVSLVQRLLLPRNLALYGEIIMKEAIVTGDLAIIEHIIQQCIDLFYRYSLQYIGYLDIVTVCLPELSSSYPDQVSYFLSKTALINSPNFKSIGIRSRSPLTGHLTPFIRTFDCQESIAASHFTLEERLNIMKFDCSVNAKNQSRYWQMYQHLYQYLLASIILAKRIAIWFFCRFTKRYSGQRTCTLMTGLTKFYSYPKQYSFLTDYLFPSASPFVESIYSKKFRLYETWDGEVIVNFKWKAFGRAYYLFIGTMFLIMFLCFTIGVTKTDEEISRENRYRLLWASSALAIWHLLFEIRQFMWRPWKYILSPWNWIDSGAYAFVLFTASLWLIDGQGPTSATALSILLLWLKLLLFIRPFEYFGIYMAIIIGVAEKVFSFLVILGFMVLGFAHAFFVLLRPQAGSSLNTPPNPDNTDDNNPWSLTTNYNAVDENGAISSTPTLIQAPDVNTNPYAWFDTSLLAVYRFMAGDWGALLNWNMRENHTLAIMAVMFSFFTVIYLLNLFIGLLGSAIDEFDERSSYLSQKAEVLAEIELFYLLPHQRRKKSWFPDILYYKANASSLRKVIKDKMKDNPNYLSNVPRHIARIAESLEFELPEIKEMQHISMNNYLKNYGLNSTIKSPGMKDGCEFFASPQPSPRVDAFKKAEQDTWFHYSDIFQSAKRPPGDNLLMYPF